MEPAIKAVYYNTNGLLEIHEQLGVGNAAVVNLPKQHQRILDCPGDKVVKHTHWYSAHLSKCRKLWPN